MQIVTKKNNLQDIYSSSPKVLVSARDRNIVLNLNLNTQLRTYEFNYDPQSPKQTITLLRESNNSDNNLNLVEMQLVPNFCLGLIAFSQTAKEELEKLKHIWTQTSPQPSLPSLIELNSNLEIQTLQAEFWQRMYGQMERQTRAIATRIATLQKQYLSLRSLHDNMQNAFATVEDYLSQAKLPPLQLAFDNQPTKKIIEPTDFVDSNSLEIKQFLPKSSRGLAMVEIHLVKKHENISGHLTVQLKACEENTCIAKWQIPYSQLPNGWLRLDLPAIDLGRKRDVELIIEWHTNIGPAPSLSLAQIQPIPEVQAHQGEMGLQCSLAFRLWTGLPGTRKVTSPYLLPIKDPEPQINLGDLGQGAMARLTEITPNLPTDKFAHIEAIDNGAKILTHPRTNGKATIAMLPFCFPTTANRLTATVVTAHEEADIIEYAMAIIKPGTDPQTCLNSDAALAFSGWTAVEANSPRQISLKLNSTVEENCHIVIAAKLAEGSTPYYGWAHWLNFCTAFESEASEERVAVASVVETPQTVSRVRDASLTTTEDSWSRVQEIENGGKIQVHPKYGVETVALLTEAIALGTTKIKSIVCTENEEASAIEYAVAVISDDDDLAARLAVTSSETALAGSGWHRVEPNHLYQIDLELPSPVDKNCYLVLATRIPQDGHQRNAWARWLDFDYISVSETATALVGSKLD